jgi:hypothetical protein
MTWRWIDEGGTTFWPLIATVQDGGWGAVGATKSVEEMMAGEGIVTGCGEGLLRNRAVIRITGRMMPPMMSQGRRDLLDIYYPVLSVRCIGYFPESPDCSQNNR